jgi:hypothetical protein
MNFSQPQELKVYFLNLATIGITFTNLENTLKIILLILSVVYTIINIHKLINKDKKDADK